MAQDAASLEVVGPSGGIGGAFENAALSFDAVSASSSSSGQLHGSASGSPTNVSIGLARSSASAAGSSSGEGGSGSVALTPFPVPSPSRSPIATAVDWKRAWSRKGRRGGSVAYCIACRPKVEREEFCPICLTCWGEPVVEFDDSHGGCTSGALIVRTTTPWAERWYQPVIKGVFCGACRGEFILLTVPCCATIADNLTRSPSSI